MDVMSKQVVKLLNFSQKNSKVKMFCVSSLDELLLKDATAFALNGICEIVTSSEEILSDDEVLFMLNSQSEVLYIRLSQSEIDGQQSNETEQEAEHQSIKETVQENNKTVQENNEAGQQSNETGQENNEVEQQSNETGQENNEAGQEINMAACFPVDDILKQGRIGVKGDTAIEIIDRLKAVDYPKSRCLDKDHFLLVKATGTWLMKNCEKRENFPTFNEILKMAKSIVSFFPSAGSFNTESPWDLFFDDKTRKENCATIITSSPLPNEIEGSDHHDVTEAEVSRNLSDSFHVETSVANDMLSCSDCDATFKKNADYKIHQLQHLDKKPHQCKLPSCNLSLNVDKNLKLHMALHKHNTSSQCPECDKKFSRLASLKAHISLHIEENTLTCQQCDKDLKP
uniref:C2H2-type domain-containing protein n=1 Tax=Daphnia galeata TaxID=27404 RepID=A0A8J2RIQ9_9CRUS|nr:unnamed protein product [Daphnia galeata]